MIDKKYIIFVLVAIFFIAASIGWVYLQSLEKKKVTEPEEVKREEKVVKKEEEIAYVEGDPNFVPIVQEQTLEDKMSQCGILEGEFKNICK